MKYLLPLLIICGCSSRWPSDSTLMRQLATSSHQLNQRGYSNYVFDADITYVTRSNVIYFRGADKISGSGCVLKGDCGRVQ